MNKDIFQVEEIEAISFDDNGQEDGTWKGWSVTLIDDPTQGFDCRDKVNADLLCDFLNENIVRDTSINDNVFDNLTEWSRLVTELSNNEISLYMKKKDYETLSEKLLEEAAKIKTETEKDIIKDKYGGNNEKTRKKYVKEMLTEENKEIKDLEFSIDYLKRRISFIKQLIHTKTVLLEVKE